MYLDFDIDFYNSSLFLLQFLYKYIFKVKYILQEDQIYNVCKKLLRIFNKFNNAFFKAIYNIYKNNNIFIEMFKNKII